MWWIGSGLSTKSVLIVKISGGVNGVNGASGANADYCSSFSM